MATIIKAATLVFLLFSSSSINAASPGNIAGSWGATKEWARDKVYMDHRSTFYCGCTFTPSGRSGGEINHQSCSYDETPAVHQARSKRLEWEHVVPASLMPARQFACWNEGIPECSKPGRNCCEKHDPEAKQMIFDLYNLVPSVGQANALRGNKRYGEIPDAGQSLGLCDFEWTGDLTEPVDLRKGDVARVWLYMHTTHGLELEPGELEMFYRWSIADPPTPWELLRNNRVKAIQGNANPFVEAYHPPELP